ncbi:MAG: hypothetical protein K1060chlam5_00900 [Candidatus Anoxychlamydiales bacterium]|nr:hypothetical protein [Candidatus Anoxychlamydiales bacterium]
MNEKTNLIDSSYEEGYLMGIHRIITLMQQQAEAFGISLEKISLHNIDPYKVKKLIKGLGEVNE